VSPAKQPTKKTEILSSEQRQRAWTNKYALPFSAKGYISQEVSSPKVGFIKDPTKPGDKEEKS